VIPLRGLYVSGWSQQLNDGSGVWTLADTAAILGDTIVSRTCGSLQPIDLLNADYAVVYSYGMAALWRAKKLLRQPFHLQRLFIITGVPRFWWGQLYGTIWNIPTTISSAIAFNTPATTWPMCARIRNADGSNYRNVDLPNGITHSQADHHYSVHQTILSELQLLRVIQK
jgi:hypothetical protein